MGHVVFGVELTLAEMAELAGVGRSTIIQRLRRGLTPEAAVATPHRHTSSPHEDVGQIKRMARENGIAYTTLYSRLRRGMSMAEALAVPVKDNIRGYNYFGRTFGPLTVISRGPKDRKKRTWLCRCIHGKTCIRSSQALMARVVVCDCKESTCPTTGIRFRARVVEIVGMQFDRLTVRGVEGKFVICDCACGATNLRRRRAMVRNGKVRSCGCLRRETTAVLRRTTAAKLDLYGETLTVVDLAAVARVSTTTVYERLRAGWSPAEIAGGQRC
jgi:hypothetical protein